MGIGPMVRVLQTHALPLGYVAIYWLLLYDIIAKNATDLSSLSWTRTNDTAVNSRVLYRLSYGGILKPTKQSLIGYLCRHRPIFPGRFQPSIFGTNELNYRVRNGNGWTLITINTDSWNSVFIKTLLQGNERIISLLNTKCKSFFQFF